MRILISNDDGIDAQGLYELILALKDDHEIIAVAPDSERSAASHALTTRDPLRITEVKLSGLPEIKAYKTSGTPADCVKLALGVLDIEPDIVVSGINMGSNLGTDTLYSGTVSAAMEGALNDYPALAVSVCCHTPKNLKSGAAAAKWGVKLLEKEGLLPRKVLNINVPDLPFDEIKGYRVAPTVFQLYNRKYDCYTDARDRNWYYLPFGKLTVCDESDDNDERWMNEGYITVTPLKPDFTDTERIRALKELLN